MRSSYRLLSVALMVAICNVFAAGCGDEDPVAAAKSCVKTNIDYDGDCIPNSTDNCPLVVNPDQSNTNGSKNVGDACVEGGGGRDATDTDEDGVPDDEDNCPENANPDQADGDKDGVGDECDHCPDHADPDPGCGDGMSKPS